MSRNSKSNVFTEKAKKWGSKIGPYAIVAILAFALGIKFSGLDLNSFKKDKTSPQNLDYSSVEQLYDTLRSKYDGKLDSNKLIDGMKKGLVEASGDPYTVYMNAQESNEFKDSLEGKFSGIGAELGKRGDQLVVVSPLDGFPAQKAGVKAGDAILEVNGEASSKWSVEQAVSKIRGEKGTDVTLKLGRDGKTVDVTVTRDDITVPSVKHEITSDNIGYLQISRFAEDTSGLAEQAAQEFKDKGVKAVVLDVRANGGGYLQSAVDVSSLWLNEGQTVVQEREGGKVKDTLRASGQNPLKGIPTVVLIDGGSASASEIVAGALKDNGAAKLVGVKSFGKGSVQELQNLKDGGELKVTIARWFTPGGKNIDKEGISPNTEVKLEEADVNAGKDPQKDKAFSLLNNQ